MLEARTSHKLTGTRTYTRSLDVTSSPALDLLPQPRAPRCHIYSVALTARRHADTIYMSDVHMTAYFPGLSRPRAPSPSLPVLAGGIVELGACLHERHEVDDHHRDVVAVRVALLPLPAERRLGDDEAGGLRAKFTYENWK